MSESAPRPTYAPKVPVGWIVRLYRSDAMGIRDTELVDKVGWRLHARCRDVLMVTASRVTCPVCQATFAVPWIGQPENRVSTCPGCGWSITAGAYHAGFRHQDLLGHAPAAFTEFAERFPLARGYGERMLLIDRVIHAVHITGGLTARNLLEGRPRVVLATLDALAGTGDPAREDAGAESGS
jgi:ribosomal protein L37AE/L43A